MGKGGKPESPRRAKLTAPEILAKSSSSTREELRQALPYLNHSQANSLRGTLTEALGKRSCKADAEEGHEQQEDFLAARGAGAGLQAMRDVSPGQDEKAAEAMEALLSQLDPNWQHDGVSLVTVQNHMRCHEGIEFCVVCSHWPYICM
jgi:hypothetical protein